MAALQTAACNPEHGLRGHKVHETDGKVILRGKSGVFSKKPQIFEMR